MECNDDTMQAVGWQRWSGGIGAEVRPGGGVEFRVWAPKRRVVEVILEGGPGRGRGKRAPAIALKPEPGSAGDFSGVVDQARPGTLYRYLLDGEGPFPDPAARFQPEGPHGPSEVIDPGRFRWTDGDWGGVGRTGQVLYELHVGTFTPEGTWDAATCHLGDLAELGITAVELMPVADFPGRFNWGYDGVNLFAPTRHYGRPDDFRRFVDRAHALGLGVILDVVYNHFGPEGNYLPEFGPYTTDRKQTEWGDAMRFDGDGSEPVRAFFLENAARWVKEYHVDGLRLDATQAFFDDSDENILAAIARQVHAAASGRRTLIIGENEPQRAELLRPVGQGGFGLDALWADDFHHAARVAATGRREAYYADYRGTPQEFLTLARQHYLYQGQRNVRQGKPRGASTAGLDPESFVLFIQNHDQVANSLRGARLHQETSPALYRVITALWLLTPGTPLFFQGQDFAASSPFLYFADFEPELGRKVRAARAGFLEQFPSLRLPETQALLADPGDPATFERCKLDHSERARRPEILALHRDLLRLRREDPVLLSARRPGGVEGAVLGADALVLRFAGQDGADRLLVANLGADLHLAALSEPLLAPPISGRWALLWSSEAPGYGGRGCPHPESEDGWRIPGQAVLVLAPAPFAEDSHE